MNNWNQFELSENSDTKNKIYVNQIYTATESTGLIKKLIKKWKVQLHSCIHSLEARTKIEIKQIKYFVIILINIWLFEKQCEPPLDIDVLAQMIVFIR